MANQITPNLPILSRLAPKPNRPLEQAAPAPPQAADSAVLGCAEAEKASPKPLEQTTLAAPLAPRAVAFQPATDLSVEAYEKTSANLFAFEGGYTKAHMVATAGLANSLMQALQGTPLELTPREARDLDEASHVYDAGKLVAREALYNDPRGPRDMPKEEWGAMWQQMCRHVEVSTERSRQSGKGSDPEVEATLGALNSKVANGDDGVREMIRHHHEKLDGSGYPDRLQGSQIPKGAQVLGICDMYEALRSPRSFRPAKDYASARAILEGDAQNGKLNVEFVKLFFEKVAKG